MPSTKTSALAMALAFLYATPIASHMIMAKPIPYGKSSIDNSPLTEDGSNFPCKQRSGVYEDQGARAQNQMAVGAKNTLSFTGSAIHGGGSCQLSLTTDKEPTKDSKFGVVLSIEGGCPGTDSPTTFDYVIPDSVAAGDYTLAWTWFNKIGNREMYMNCAPITVTNSKTKRNNISASDDLSFGKRDAASYPEMFVANAGNGCKTADSVDLEFPNPGEVLQKAGKGALAPPTGTCPGKKSVSLGATKAASPSGNSSNPSSNSTSASPSASAPGTATILASPSPNAGTGGSAPASPSAGGSSANPSASPSAAGNASPASPSTPASGSNSTGSGAAAPSGAAAGSGTASGSGGLQCSSDGKSFTLSGSTVAQPVAAGTKCVDGAINFAKRSAKFAKINVGGWN